MDSFVLKTKNGKTVQIRKSTDNELKLYAVEDHVRKTCVQIQTRERNRKKEMAFCFTYKGAVYSPRVERGNLKLELVSGSSMLESHWFEMEPQSGEHFGLKSVSEPESYITVQFGPRDSRANFSRKKYILSLCNNDQQCVYVTNERVGFV